jgi:hypothetical protein
MTTHEQAARNHDNETARAARAAHARLMRGDLVTLRVYYMPWRLEAFPDGDVPEGWLLAWPAPVPTDRTSDQLVAWFAARSGWVPYLTGARSPGSDLPLTPPA